MHSLTLTRDNRHDILDILQRDGWVVACLCAQWCGTCAGYRAAFDRLAQNHPDKKFVWIDIEDQADLIGDLDVENFPTLLLQRGQAVAFFGTVVPDPNVAGRLIAAQDGLDEQALRALADGSAQRRAWQDECNLLELLA